LKTTCKHRLAALALASSAAVAISAAGGTAFADDGHVDSDNASIGIGEAQIDQHSDVANFSVAASNSGFNQAHNDVDQNNDNWQTCEADTKGGGTLGLSIGEEESGAADATGGNIGGDCSNDATNSNDANPEASIHTGAASAGNETSTTVEQTNSGGVDITSDNTGSVAGTDDDAHVHQNGVSVGAGFLGVSQGSSVSNESLALANSGGNHAGNNVDQNNWNEQHGSANTSGGWTVGVSAGEESGDASATGGNTGG
jgi:hypothetical protein